MDIHIIYQDADILCINKPAGLVMHSDGKTEEYSVADWVMEHFPEMQHVGEPWVSEHQGQERVIYRPGIVHRLDRETSGIVILAKHQDAFIYLKDQFQNRTLQKIYHSCVYGIPTAREGLINEPIGRSGKDFRMWQAGRGARGSLRSAETEYRVLATYRLSPEAAYAYIEWRPHTGRTHQIRVHAKYIHHPLVGDTLYGGKRTTQQPSLGFERHALHAYMIRFMTPSGQDMTLSAPFPEDFQRVREKFLLNS
ncbi:MAG: RluA family pseudouridine synthase [Candidatus Pacebacteria bacterium]|nr:RluA family pseudouridine synthase [Candidatus Paceibacterota bacterium]MCD8507845.1 RluA family pseudouridine synthase [Candidatus Paceibacterota bacterium]MCD8527818.1 RluA family pseudouridine synthase [Candidatus Paceibacterota bacterium]MCD8563524.1 RluA family pseudouridine synthase [Candidatus Paceibacterota bacterium]